MVNVDLRKVLDLAIRSYGIDSPQALKASQALDEQIVREQLTYNALKRKGYITIMVNEIKVDDKIVKLV